MTKTKILIISGEPSGDLHASNLVRELKKARPDLSFFGMGGSLSRKAGVEVIFDISDLALVGVIEVIKNINVVGKAFKTVLAKVDSSHPDLAILVDYPGFNLRLAKELKKRNIPVVYYISPQVWAWGKDRIGIIKKCVKKILVFFKFEEELYKKHDVDAEFVGHPLLDTVNVTSSKEETLKKYGLSKDILTIALLPGSRKMEVRSFLSMLMQAAKIISASIGSLQFIIAKHPDLPNAIYEDAIRASEQNIKIANGDTHNIVNASDFAIVASGTATLETAIIGTPLIVTYKVNLVTFLLYKLVSYTKFIGLVNIVAGKEVAPELLQANATPEKIAAKCIEMLNDKKRLSETKEMLRVVRASLGDRGATDRAAKAILPLLQ